MAYENSEKRLAEIIKVDLHIHSKASYYKDGSIVENSDSKHLDTLLGKLDEHQIALFCISDHNRFDYRLYSEAKNKVLAGNYSFVKNNLPAVEFDVMLESGKPRSHIIAVFDDSNDEKLSKLQTNMFSVRELKSNDDSYNIDEFEMVLKKIGIQCILIVHQRQGLNNKRKGSQSLSAAVDDPYQFIQCGYIDALEYNTPRVEGIIKKSLRDVDLTFPIITGSDCHEWESYPYHDKLAKRVNRDFSKFKCLPTFRGLLLSISSFKSRCSRINNSNENYIKSISVNGRVVPLSNGINAVIGDNGSGKSYLLSVLSKQTEKKYSAISKMNQIELYKTDNFQTANLKYVKQGSIIEEVNKGKLFDANNKTYFSDIQGTEDFEGDIKKYFDDVEKYVLKRIEINEAENNIAGKELAVKPIDRNVFYPLIEKDLENDDFKEDDIRINSLISIYRKYTKEINDNRDYYEKNMILTDLEENGKNMRKIIYRIMESVDEKKLFNSVKSFILKEIGELENYYDIQRNSYEKEIVQTKAQQDDFIQSIKNLIKLKNEKNTYPEFPKKKKGISVKQYKGYEFVKVADYNEMDLEETFYNKCFNNGYKSKENISSIITKDQFSAALPRYTINEIDEYKDKVIGGFLKEWKSEKTYISEVSAGKAVGNTPGEVSLVYYKFQIKEDYDEYEVLLIDQPEDDINPLKINEFLLNYLHGIRDKKQVILVTHNPLLVVNLDVDNVIFLRKDKNKIDALSGALEYECDEYKVLDLVMNNLDGGYDAVNRRLKVYERQYK